MSFAGLQRNLMTDEDVGLREDDEHFHDYTFTILENMGKSNLRPPFLSQDPVLFCSSIGLL